MTDQGQQNDTDLYLAASVGHHAVVQNKKKTNEDPSKRSEGKQIRAGLYWEYLSKTDKGKVRENDTNGWRELIGRHKEQG